MARRFIELQEVASLLNVSPDELGDMRSRGDIYGYRDGNTWKFKIDEVRRVASDRGIQISEASLAGEISVASDSMASSSVDDDLDALSNVDEIDPGESVLVTDVNLGLGPEQSASSTVIGENEDLVSDSGSDLQLVSEDRAPSREPSETLDPNDTGSDLQLIRDSADGSPLTPADSDVLSSGSDSLQLIEESSSSSSSGSKVEGMTGDLNLDMASGADFALGESDLQLVDSSADVVQGGLSDSESGSISIDLDFDDDDDLVLGNGTGSDVALSPSDSGISLSSPSDTGLLLSGDSLDLGGSAAESALELPEEIVPLDESAAGPESGTQLGIDEDFLLTPVEESPGEESDSGSQVIALDTDDSYSEDAATLLETDASAPITEAGAGEFAGGAVAAGAAPSITIPTMATEAPYSIWNVLTLVTITCFLSMTGMFMYDLVRHMWSWDQPWSVNSQMMDWILSLLE